MRNVTGAMQIDLFPNRIHRCRLFLFIAFNPFYCCLVGDLMSADIVCYNQHSLEVQLKSPQAENSPSWFLRTCHHSDFDDHMPDASNANELICHHQPSSTNDISECMHRVSLTRDGPQIEMEKQLIVTWSIAWCMSTCWRYNQTDQSESHLLRDNRKLSWECARNFNGIG